MAGDYFLEVTLPLLVETVVALGVLALGVVALRRGRAGAWFVVASGALWGAVQVVYAVDLVAVELGTQGLGGLVHDHGLLVPLRYLRLLGVVLLLPALATAVVPVRPGDRSATADQARSGS
ncbi:hypothetical protein ABKW28_16650 [Nocardioides sp. 31GB23]|uniref:hypothetical protein n=1 Tax=Nocardioides sp. 31GB23 TaxID=3156065 RepID=UPI0032AFCBE9